MKRGRSELTGGTGDVSPQLLTMAITMSAANTFTQSEIPLPVNRFREKGKSVIVIEMLKTYWDLSELDANNAAGGNVLQILGQISTASQTTSNPGLTQVVAWAQKSYRGAFTAAGTFQAINEEPITVDHTDGAGHGVLIATDNIFLGLNTIGYTAAASANIKVLYRFKQITIEEYIGIVQSQQ